MAHFVRFAHNVVSGNPSRSRSRWRQRGEHANERRFSGAIWPKQAKNFAILYGEADGVYRDKLAESLRQLVNFDSALRRFQPCILRGREFLRRFHKRDHQCFCCGCNDTGSSTVAVMPVKNRCCGFGSETLMANVRMSRLVRLTSRCVAKSPSTPLKNTLP